MFQKRIIHPYQGPSSAATSSPYIYWPRINKHACIASPPLPQITFLIIIPQILLEPLFLPLPTFRRPVPQIVMRAGDAISLAAIRTLLATLTLALLGLLIV